MTAAMLSNLITHLAERGTAVHTIIPTLGRLRQEGQHEFRASLSHIARPCLEKTTGKRDRGIAQNKGPGFNPQHSIKLCVNEIHPILRCRANELTS